MAGRAVLWGLACGGQAGAETALRILAEEIELGMTLLANKFEEESVEPFARAESLDPVEPRWPYLRGVALVGRNPDEALPCLRRAAASPL